MSIHRDRYLSGTAFFVGVRYLKGGRSVRVFDRTLRWRAAARAMTRGGQPVRLVARVLLVPEASVKRVLAPTWRFGA